MNFLIQYPIGIVGMPKNASLHSFIAIQESRSGYFLQLVYFVVRLNGQKFLACFLSLLLASIEYSLKGVSGLCRDIDVKLTYELSDLNVEKNALHTGLECIVRQKSSLVVHIFVKVQSCYQTNYAQQLTRRKILQSHSDNAQNLQCSKYQDLLSTSCHLFSPQKS